MSYRLTINPAVEAPGTDEIVLEFPTIDMLNAAHSCCADLLLFLQDEILVMNDYSNIFIKEKFIDGEWEEIQ